MSADTSTEAVETQLLVAAHRLIVNLILSVEMHGGHENCGTCQRHLYDARNLLNQLREAAGMPQMDSAAIAARSEAKP